MNRSIVRGALIAAVLALAACGSSGSSSPATPSAPVASSATTISILGDKGSQSFVPNPAPNGQLQLQWKNTDSITHHIAATDGSFDAGEVGPGQTSKVVTMTTDGTNYYCMIHPDMIGAVDSNAGAPPKCSGQYC
jgi:plastocyanin